MKRASYGFAVLFLCTCTLFSGGCTSGAPPGEMEIEGSRPTPEADMPEGGVDFLEMLRRGAREYEDVDDYTADFTKQQRIRGRLLPEEEIFMKFRKPHDIYMRWTGKVDHGQEVLYAGERYGGKIIAHKGGLLLSRITVSLDPNGGRAMKKNLRPITCAGIGFLVNSLLEVSEEAERNGDMSVEYRGVVETPGGEAHDFIRYLPEGEDYPCYRAVICLDTDTGFPLFYEAFDREGNLLERYTYGDVETNEGLDDEDFDRHNDDYSFGFF